MAVKAYILIETAVGRIKEVVESLKGLEGLISLDAVTGPYDIIAVVEAKNINAIGELVTGKIHPVPGITRTVTCLAV